MSITISVIIPWYQGQRYLSGLLSMMERNAEILLDKAGKEMEVLLVNDSPWENLEAELKKQADGAAAYRLKVITNPQNSGIHATRVNGLKAAEGEYVQFLDQDDRVMNRCLLSQYSSIGDADFVIGNGYDGERDGGRHLIFANSIAQAAAGDLKCQYYYNNLIRSPGQVLIRKSSIPVYWSEQIMKNNGSDDAFLWILMLCSGAKAAINEELVYEHVYTGENSSSNNEAMLLSQMEVAEKLKGIASPIGMWAFCRRAKYYCTSDAGHKLRYPDVGLLRAIFSHVRMKA
jgi:glycosyltransferase involved in cell wall biosynthesis